MKKQVLTALALGGALLLSSCSGNPNGLAVINMKDVTANPATQDAITAQQTTPQFVVAWILWGTPTPTPYREPRAGEVTPPPVATEVAAVPTATLPATATLPPTATTAAANASTGSGGSVGKGDPTTGMRVFTGLGGCSSCHDITMGHTVVGPTLKGISKTAVTRKPGMTAEDYLYESITAPNKFVVKSFAQGLMPQTFKSTLSARQIDDVIAYLMSLK
jgi:cytochrome c2